MCDAEFIYYNKWDRYAREVTGMPMEDYSESLDEIARLRGQLEDFTIKYDRLMKEAEALTGEVHRLRGEVKRRGEMLKECSAHVLISNGYARGKGWRNTEATSAVLIAEIESLED